MDIHVDIGTSYCLNEQQKAILRHDDGPLLIVAGPGAGKTFTLILRVLNLLLHGCAEPSQIILCTYTEKAAQGLLDRLMTLAKKVEYRGNLAEIRVGTIHALCDRLLREYLYDDMLGNDYQVLDEFEQRLFIYHHLNEIAPPYSSHAIYAKEGGEWAIAKQLQQYFNTMMEELVKIQLVCQEENRFLNQIGLAYRRYCALLKEHNKMSFSAQSYKTYQLLKNPDVSARILAHIRYVFVDEYQDTNNIQERILLTMASATGNICVVGDEDQAIYRFRGATVRNILEFDTKVSACTTLPLTINYRSHKEIIERYNDWMKTGNWSEKGKLRFRKQKEITPDPTATHKQYPAVVKVEGKNDLDEAEQVARCIQFLKTSGAITDYNQVALLLYSVKPLYSGAYVSALKACGIPVFCPRARSYFEHKEVRLLMACFAVLLRYTGIEEEQTSQEQHDFDLYIQNKCVKVLQEEFTLLYETLAGGLTIEISKPANEYNANVEQQPQAKPTLMDYFYRLLSLEPFVSFLKEEACMRNLMLFSKKLHTFQTFYRFTHIDQQAINAVQKAFFTVFYRLLKDEGMNEYEDLEETFPSGHVLLMTIHQAKGLEFPVVIVGSLRYSRSGGDVIGREMGQFYERGENFEPESSIPGFDLMRLYYVAFSRAEKLLILTYHLAKRPNREFEPILHNLPKWGDARALWAKEISYSHNIKEPVHMKHRYSFTGDIQCYETCPRQYQYFREYEFVEGRPRDVLFGLLVHQTLEGIHRMALAGRLGVLSHQRIEAMVRKNAVRLRQSHYGDEETGTEERALTQVYNYFEQNWRELRGVREVEKDIIFEQENYILTGRIDLLRENCGLLELVDFKTEPKPRADSTRLFDYERQLCIYAHVLECRYNLRPDRLVLYWTQEQHRADAIMEISYQPDLVEHVGRSLEQIVHKICSQDFQVITVPEAHVCRRCSMLHYCTRDGLFTRCVREENALLQLPRRLLR